MIAQLWDYLDGELPSERMEELAEHLALCKRCYPQYQFEIAFLEAVARLRARAPGPSRSLAERLRRVLPTRSG